MFTPTKAELEELGFYFIEERDYDNWKIHYVGSYMWENGSKYPIHITFKDNEFELGQHSNTFSQLYPESIEDIETIIRMFNPN